MLVYFPKGMVLCMYTRERVQNIALKSLLGRVCTAPASVLEWSHGGLGESFTWIVSPAIPPLPRRSKLYLGPGVSLVLAAARGLGSVLTVVLCFFLTCL